MVDPLTATAIGGSLLGGIGSAIGGSGPQYMMGTTEEDINAALKQIRQGFRGARDVYGAGGTIGDFSFSGGSRLTGKEVRRDNIRDAFKDFLMDKGFSEEYAKKRSKTAKGLNKKKAFRNFIEDSDKDYGLTVRKKKIRGLPQTEGFSLNEVGGFGPGFGAANINQGALLELALGGKFGG